MLNDGHVPKFFTIPEEKQIGSRVSHKMGNICPWALRANV